MVRFGPAWLGMVRCGSARFGTISMRCLITDDVRKVEDFINQAWTQFDTVLEVPLKELFHEPGNNGLKHIWKYGSADLVVYRDNKLICVIEVGGSHHVKDDKQKKNDARKWKLCDVNGVKCIGIMNGVQDGLSKRQFRKLIGSVLWKK